MNKPCSPEVGSASTRGPFASQCFHSQDRRLTAGVERSAPVREASVLDPQRPSCSSDRYGWLPVIDSSATSGSAIDLTALCQTQCALTSTPSTCPCSSPSLECPNTDSRSRWCAVRWFCVLFAKHQAGFSSARPSVRCLGLGLGTLIEKALPRGASSREWAPCSSWSWSGSRAWTRSQTLLSTEIPLGRGPHTRSPSNYSSTWRLTRAYQDKLWEARAVSLGAQWLALQRWVCEPCFLAFQSQPRHWSWQLSWPDFRHWQRLGSPQCWPGWLHGLETRVAELAQLKPSYSFNTGYCRFLFYSLMNGT